MTAMQSDMNSAQLFNFGTEFGWNEIEANLLGASGMINGNTPISFIRHSLDQYTKAFQDPTTQDEASKIGKTPIPSTKICADKDGKVVPCTSSERVQGGKNIIGKILEGLYAIGKTTGDVAGQTIDPEYKGSGDTTLYGDFSVEDITKRLFLLILAVGLILLAVYLVSK